MDTTKAQPPAQPPAFDIDLGLEGSLAIVTGAAGQIGRVIVDALLAAGCFVGAFDMNIPPGLRSHERLQWTRVDITNEDAIQKVWSEPRNRFGKVPTICICAAGVDLSFLDQYESAADMPIDQFRRTLDVNVTGTFIVAKMWLSYIRYYIESGGSRLLEPLRNVSLIIIGSEAGILGVPGNPDYAASKSAIQYGLVKSLGPDAARIFDRAIVNAIAPGAVDTPQFRKECAGNPAALWAGAQATVATKKAVAIEHVARTCLLLASEKWSGSTTGQIVRVDGGKSGRLFWGQDGAPI